MVNRISRLNRCWAVIAIAGCFVLRAELVHAQAAAQEPINVVHAGIDRLYAGLDYVFGLAEEQKNLETLKSTLDVFFVGVDPKKPAVVQVYVRKGEFNQVLHVPTTGLSKNFRNNLRALGLRNKALGAGTYSVSGLFDGYMKEFSGTATQTAVTIIGKDRVDLKPLGDLVAFKKKLDPDDHDLIATIKNDLGLQKERENAIEEVRKQVMPGLKKLKEESDSEFELRKLTIEQQISEIKQIYAEAALITAVGEVSVTKKHAMMETELVALEKTPLDAGIALLGKEPSYFASIPLNETEPLSGFINFHLDAMRKEHLEAFLKQARPLIKKQIEESDTATAEAKDYVAQTTDIVIDVLEQSAKAEILDGFVNVTANASKLHTMVGGTRGDGAIVVKGLTKLKQTVDVQMDTEKVGDVSLHKITLPPKLTELEEIYGPNLVLIVGTGPKAIWYALGENAEAKIKEAIALGGKPAEAKTNVIASLHAKALLWYKLFDGVRLKNKKGNEENRKVAIAALEKGDDTFDFKLEIDGKKLKSKFILHEGMLRYFGKVGAKFVRDNLQN